ncbi:Swt1 family HEPN domain-containing protein [Streptomyces sp. NPDC090085]|uniref:Swt1 family HEPN domain-containing protein n=1 Tax=Streptomyces sp. NPDC090085 TaxID=3365943 RepID=UPI0038058CE6
MTTGRTPMIPTGPFDEWSDDVRGALGRAVAHGMPEGSLALYARWWQLETWLRELVYVELRARYGAKWIDEVKAALGRQRQDAEFKHMSTADSENPLAYLDYSQLLIVVEANWEQMKYALLERKSWEGRQGELMRIRHRIGHVRKPHQDDLGRLEQTLRDLERGAFIACASYNSRRRPDLEECGDPVSKGWIGGAHPTARRLIRHAEIQYGVSLEVDVSRRPWATWPDSLEKAEGIFWHAEFYLRDRILDFRALWNQIKGISPIIVHVLASDPHVFKVTFSAVDDPGVISDAIGACFDSVLHCSRPRSQGLGLSGMSEGEFRQWGVRTASIDYRVMGPSGWSTVDETTIPISMFASGGGVEILPNW